MVFEHLHMVHSSGQVLQVHVLEYMPALHFKICTSKPALHFKERKLWSILCITLYDDHILSLYSGLIKWAKQVSPVSSYILKFWLLWELNEQNKCVMLRTESGRCECSSDTRYYNYPNHVDISISLKDPKGFSQLQQAPYERGSTLKLEHIQGEKI